MPSPVVPSGRELAALWSAAVGRLQVDLNPATWATWVNGTRAVCIDDGVLLIESPRAANCEWLNQTLAAAVARALTEVATEPMDARFVPLSAPLATSESVTPPGTVFGAIDCSFTFERYIETAGNRVALRTCRDLVVGDGADVSPVVLFGPPGMGKTHLLHAAACEASARGWPVVCMTGEQFTSAYLGALRAKEVEAFQEHMRNTRLFVIDDLQYLEGKAGTLDELGHTIDAVRHAGGLIAVGSERDPATMALPDRLKSRLSEGVRARIMPFCYADRLLFIGRRAAEMRVDLPRWAVERVAGMEAPCVRVLQGCVKAAAVLARSGRLEAGELDTALNQSAVRALAPEAGGERALIEAIATHFETSYDELVSRKSGSTLQLARGVVVAALHERGRSFSQIGATLDKRDKASVHSLVDRGRRALAEDGRLRERLAGAS